MKNTGRRYWFSVKRYGWGWGLPATWEGWVVLLTWLAVVVPVSGWLAAHKDVVLALPFVVFMTVVLLLICFAKGEPPRWRWGGRD
ncbi:MAG: hypothetical protein ACRETW_05590 [Stenotrophobium sp.]